MTTAFSNPDEIEGLFDHNDPAAAGADSTQLFVNPDEKPSPVIDDTTTTPTTPIEIDEYDDGNTMYMTTFFLVLMVLYIGFCVYYRKVKTRRTVGDYGEGSAARDQQRRENQSVLDESTSATARARANTEDQAKLEERKESIKKALLLRLIVDEEEEEESGERKEDCNKEHNGDCVCEQCQYWKWESNEAAGEAKGETKSGGEDSGSHAVITDSSAAAVTRGVVTIEEESDEDDDKYAEFLAVAGLASNKEETAHTSGSKAEDDLDIEAQNLDNSKESIVNEKDSTVSSPPSSPTLAPLSPPQSPKPSPRAQLSAAISPPSHSLPSPRKYIEDLNCGSTARNAMACSNHNVTSCGSLNAANCSSSIQGKLKSITSNAGNSGTPTISLSAVLSTYGEECNICLSQFQVGDRVAWRSHHDDGKKAVLPDDGVETTDGVPTTDVNNSVMTNCVINSVPNDATPDATTSNKAAVATGGCTHIFHDECLSRWLLVRDGCPICRRSYFPNSGESNPTTEAAADSSGGVASNNTRNEVDLERGENANNDEASSSGAAPANRGRARVDLTGSWW